MTLSTDCSLLRLRGRNLLIIQCPEGRKGLEVNDSLAFLLERAKVGSFTAESLAEALAAEYDLSADTALQDTLETIDLWRNLRILTD